MALKSIKSVHKPLPKSEEAMRAKEIVNNSFKVDNRNAVHVSPADLKTTTRGWRVTTVTKIPGERARLHRLAITVPKGYIGKFSKCPEVQIDCDCMRHLFVWNWALLKKNAATKDYTNGMPPDITNPGYVPGCCKHGLVAIRSLLAVDPMWPAATISKTGHTHEGKPVTLQSLKDSAEDVHWKKMTKAQKLAWLDAHPKSKYAKLAESLGSTRYERDPDAPPKGSVNLATVKMMKKDDEI